jgi:hypothetical protein
MISAHDSCVKGSVNVNQYMHADIVYVAEWYDLYFKLAERLITKQ